LPHVNHNFLCKQALTDANGAVAEGSGADQSDVNDAGIFLDENIFRIFSERILFR
jgi:hypothetical protein